MLAELNRDRAEAKADRNDNKIQSEWNIQQNFFKKCHAFTSDVRSGEGAGECGEERGFAVQVWRRVCGAGGSDC